MYIWVLARTEGGDLDKIIAKCKECNITWLAIKAGDQGSTGWMPTRRGLPQFSADIVKRLHDAGIRVFGWSYDCPRRYKNAKGVMVDRGDILEKQAKIVKKVADAGADGFIIDAEVEWDRAENPDTDAWAYLADIRAQGLPPDFLLADAPWASVGAHPRFPTTEFGKGVDFRCPQALWVLKTDRKKVVEGPVDDMCDAYAFQWDTYEAWAANKRKPKAPEAIKPHLTGGGLFDAGSRKIMPHELPYFENFMRQRGCPGVLYWVWEAVPERTWNWLRQVAPY